MMKKIDRLGTNKEKTAMKRLISLILALVLALALTACGGKEPTDPETDASGKDDAVSADPVQNEPAQNDAAQDEPAQNEPAQKEVPSPKANSKLVFAYRGCPLPMNAEFAPLLDYIGEADSYFEAASCAFDGLDKTYTYSDVEIITYPDGDVDYISSIRLLSSAAATPEGITIGSTKDDVIAAYGEDCEMIGNEYTYEDGDAQLIIIFKDDAVTSVEYAAVNPLLV